MEEYQLELSDECLISITDQNNMILLVKECEEVETRILTSPTSSYSYELEQNQVESCDDHLNEVTSVNATRDPSKIHTKSSLGQGVEEIDNDGFRTPVKFVDEELRFNGLKCPPVPRKPKAKLLGKRKRVCRNLQIEFVNEVESALRLVINGDHPKVKKARSQSR